MWVFVLGKVNINDMFWRRYGWIGVWIIFLDMYGFFRRSNEVSLYLFLCCEFLGVFWRNLFGVVGYN